MHQTPPPDDDQPALDAKIVALLGDQLADTAGAAPVDVQSIQRVKQALLRRIAASNSAEHLTVQAAAGDWCPFGRGVQIKVLHEAAGVMSYLLRLQAGARLPAHRHPIDEECVVLEGEVQIGELRIAAGGFHLGRQDRLHDQLRSDAGALIFLRGATPDAALSV
jgi:anti-sigma factor ChrR (cupin superfamily)